MADWLRMVMWSGLSVTILRAESDTREYTLIVAYGEVSAARQADFLCHPLTLLRVALGQPLITGQPSVTIS